MWFILELVNAISGFVRSYAESYCICEIWLLCGYLFLQKKNKQLASLEIDNILMQLLQWHFCAKILILQKSNHAKSIVTLA